MLITIPQTQFINLPIERINGYKPLVVVPNAFTTAYNTYTIPSALFSDAHRFIAPLPIVKSINVPNREVIPGRTAIYGSAMRRYLDNLKGRQYNQL